MLTGHEGSVNLRIHINGEVLVLDDLGISLVDLTVDPLLKHWTDDGVDDICYVLPR